MPLRFPDVCFIGKISFPEPVQADDAKRIRPPPLRQTEFKVPVFHQSERFKPGDQFDRLIPGDKERTGKAFQRGGNLPVLIIVQMLERVLDEDARRPVGGMPPSGKKSSARPHEEGTDNEHRSSDKQCFKRGHTLTAPGFRQKYSWPAWN